MSKTVCPVCSLPPELLSQADAQLTARVSSAEIRDMLAAHQQSVTSRELTNHSRHMRPVITESCDSLDESLILLSPDMSQDNMLTCLYEESLQQVNRLRKLARQTGSLKIEKALLDASKHVESLAQSRQNVLRVRQWERERLTGTTSTQHSSKPVGIPTDLQGEGQETGASYTPIDFKNHPVFGEAYARLKDSGLPLSLEVKEQLERDFPSTEVVNS